MAPRICCQDKCCSCYLCYVLFFWRRKTSWRSCAVKGRSMYVTVRGNKKRLLLCSSFMRWEIYYTVFMAKGCIFSSWLRWSINVDGNTSKHLRVQHLKRELINLQSSAYKCNIPWAEQHDTSIWHACADTEVIGLSLQFTIVFMCGGGGVSGWE